MSMCGDTPENAIGSAIAMHRNGDYLGAEALCEEVLAVDGTDADALHLLGVLKHERGEDPGALELIEKALALRPNVAIAHTNLAEVYRSLGDFERAAGCCKLALRLWPGFAVAMCNLGLLYQTAGRHEEAVDQFRRALKFAPNLAPVHNNLGASLREMGELEEAREHFRRAVELAPAFAPALSNLGRILLEGGQPSEALPHCLEAARLEPDLAAVHVTLGKVLATLERWADARAAYLNALRLDPELAAAYANLGLALQNQGRPGEALLWLTRAVELDQKSSLFQRLLGELHLELHEPSEAIPCLERAIALAPGGGSDLRVAMGKAMQAEGRLAEAEEQYSHALRLQPDSANAQVLLGGLRLDQGRIDEAQSAFREALRTQPSYPAAHARLATLLRGEMPEADIGALQTMLDDRRLGDEPRAALLFGLAHVLDARGEYARAAACMNEANALANARDQRGCGPVDHGSFTDEILRLFSLDFLASLAGAGAETKRPVFVFGLPRSGTTLVEQILATHSRVHGAGELRLVRASFAAIPGIVGRAGPPIECVPFLDAESATRLAALHLAGLSRYDGGSADRIVDKMPGNFTFLGLLSILFPKATFIHCTRDLRDIAVSCWMTHFSEIRWANDPECMADYFRQHHRLMSHWRAVLPGLVHDVDYENLVADVEPVARQLVAACGLEWEPGCLEFHRNERPVRTASATQVRRPIYAHSVGRWRNYEPALGDLFAKLPLQDA